jgi:predicted phosphoribosyltransferase
MFSDRREAGVRLAEGLARRTWAPPIVVLAIPRGGVVVAAPVARALEAPLDVVVPRKLGAPGNPELAIGAVAPGVRVLDQRMMGILGVTEDYLEREVEAQEREIERRTTMYREGREPPALAGATVIVVDDGVATGSTAMAALGWVRAAGAARVVFAAPVGPRAALAELGAYADDVIILETPSSFRAVGEWFAVFDQVTDEQVLAELRGAA